MKPSSGFAFLRLFEANVAPTPTHYVSREFHRNKSLWRWRGHLLCLCNANRNRRYLRFAMSAKQMETSNANANGSNENSVQTPHASRTTGQVGLVSSRSSSNKWKNKNAQIYIVKSKININFAFSKFRPSAGGWLARCDQSLRFSFSCMFSKCAQRFSE